MNVVRNTIGHQLLRGSPLVLIGAWLCWLAFDHSYALISARSDPAAAASLRPYNGAAFSGEMNYRIQKGVRPLVTSNDIRRARVVLREDPLNRVAIRTLGIWEDLKGGNKKALYWMALANKVSRRDGIVQLWLQEYYKRSGQPTRYWRHVNSLLLVKPLATQSILTNMQSVLDQEAFRAALSPYVAHRTSWVAPLLTSMINRDAAIVTAILLPVVQRSGPEGYSGILDQLIFAVGAAGQLKTAEALADATYRQHDFLYARSDRIVFSPRELRFGRFSWNFPNTDSVSATSSDGGDVLVESLPQGKGVFATRAFLLAGERHLIVNYLKIHDEGPTDGAVSWSVYCYRKGAKSLVNVTSQSEDGDGRSVARFDIPDQCHAAELTAYFDGSDSSFGDAVTLKDLRVAVR